MTSEVWGARLDGGYLGTDWVKELLADFHSEENRAEMLEKELLNKKTSLEHLRGILCTVADRAERAEVREATLREALENQKQSYEAHLTGVRATEAVPTRGEA